MLRKNSDKVYGCSGKVAPEGAIKPTGGEVFYNVASYGGTDP
jgi:hypothetical protein